MPGEARAGLLAARDLRGRAFCATLSGAVDSWLAELLSEATGGDPTGLALAAVGGYGRAELAPGSDIDVVLLHHRRRDVAEVAPRIWYPIWDAKYKLGHAVRTVREAVRLATDDADTATALLDTRHVAGDPELTAQLAERARTLWQKRSRRWLAELGRRVADRHARAGEVAFLLEPDLKDGRGGLRDVHCLRWAEAADRVLFPEDHPALEAAYHVLLDVRVELQRLTGRAGNQLVLELQDDVADALGLADADALMADIATAARTIAWTSDETWGRIAATFAGPTRVAGGRDRRLGEGLVLRDGEIHLAADAEPAADPGLCLAAAAAAAQHGTRIDRASLDRLAAETPVFPDPWPPGARGRLVEVLAAGHAALGPLESLDQRGLLVRVLPEWAMVRSKPQRNAYHRFTVDRHLLETAANAAALADRVGRPDLLLTGALMHDLGKGYPGDHTDVGVELVGAIAPRMGFDEADTAVLVDLVRLHLFLPDVATRRDISDDHTIRLVAETVGSSETLALLAALTEADSLATSSAAWSPWKAGLVRDLAARAAHVLAGGEIHEVAWSSFPTPEIRELVAVRRSSSRFDGDRLVVVAPDRPGLFSRTAGVLALHGLDVLEADAFTSDDGMAANQFRVALPDDRPVDRSRVLADVARALDRTLALEARLAERARVYARRARSPQTPERRVSFDNDASATATVVEVRAPDSIGVLYRITHALAEMGLDIRHAKIQTIGPQVVDAFYVRSTLHRAKVTDDEHLAEIRRAVLHGLTPPAEG